MKKRPSKKKLEDFEEDFEDIPTKKELNEDETRFQRQLRKLKSMIRPKKVGDQAQKAKKDALKYKPKKGENPR